MPKVIKKRIGKKVGKEEDIKESIGDIREKFKQKQKTLVYSLIIFIVFISSIASVVIYKKVTTSKALESEAEGYALFYADKVTAPSMLPGERFKKALEAFKRSYTTKEKPVVLFYIANCYYELGNLDETIKNLKDLTSRFPDSLITPLAYYKMAIAYQKKNDLDDALNALRSLYSIKNSPLQDLALMESGKILELQGKNEDAKKMYQELIKSFPKSPLANEATKKIGQ